MSGQLCRLTPGSRPARPLALHRGAAVKLKVSVCGWLVGLLLVSLSGAVASENLEAGARGYVVDAWPPEKGLPQNTVTGIAQTSDGYLWLATLDGMARFDGVRFRLFKSGDTPELGSGRIRFLFTGRHGQLWPSTQEGGLIRFLNGRFTPLTLPETKGPRSAVAQVAEEESGALWLSTEDGNVSRLAGSQYTNISTNWSSEPRTAFEVRADSLGRLWVVCGTGLYRLSGQALGPAVQGKPGEYYVLCPSHSGGWWLSAKGQMRLWRDGRWEAAAGKPDVAASGITCGIEDRNGHLWVGTATNGLFRCDTNGAVMQFTKRDGLSSSSVRALFEDSEGNLWVGTQDGGLNRLRLPLFTVFGTAQGLTSERVTTVCEGAAGELWVGTDGYGLNLLTGGAARPAGEDPTAASWRVAAVLADRAGKIWVGLRSGGVFRWHDGQYTAVTGFPTAMLPMRSLYEDSHGAIWIGQRKTKTLVCVEGDSVRTVELPPSLPLVDIRVSAEDGAGAMWFGTDGTGLLRWKDGQFTQYNRENGLSSDFVWALQPEPDGALWIGTYGGGLSRLKEGRMVSCTVHDGLADDVICHIADDGRGQYWFSSNQGIFRVGKAELNEFADGKRGRIQCVAYGRADGLPTLECEGGCQPSGWRSRDGRLWFPTSRGLLVVDSADVKTNTVAPPVHIESLVVDGKVIEARAWQGNDFSESLKQPVPPSLQLKPESQRSPAQAGRLRHYPSLELKPGSRRFEFHYVGLNFTAPETLRFRHKLEGVDAEWVDTGGQRTASYDKLPHGAYTFRVQACNREGVWNQAGDALGFTVLPFFWQTRWFIGLFLLVFGAGVGGSVRYILRRRHERQVGLLEQVNALERERTRIARDIHDDLGGSLTEVGYLGAIAVRDSKSLGEAQEQLTRITERVRDAARKLDETVWAVNPNNDSPSHLATYLGHFAREFLEPTDIRCRLEIESNLPAVTLSAEVRHNVFLIVKEALNNAVKHSAAHELWFRLKMSDGTMHIEISDDGRGFRSDARPEGGNGLRNMAARMKDIGGRFTVRSAAGEGTAVCLELPMNGDRARASRARGRPIRMGGAGDGESA